MPFNLKAQRLALSLFKVLCCFVRMSMLSSVQLIRIQHLFPVSFPPSPADSSRPAQSLNLHCLFSRTGPCPYNSPSRSPRAPGWCNARTFCIADWSRSLWMYSLWRRKLGRKLPWKSSLPRYCTVNNSIRPANTWPKDSQPAGWQVTWDRISVTRDVGRM